MNINSPQELFISDLGRALAGEETVAKGLQQMIQQVENPELKNALSAHETQTRQQIANLNEIFTVLGQPPQRIPCYSAEGLAREYTECASAINSPELKDLATAMAAGKVEHLEIAGYKTLLLGASELGDQRVIKLLRQNMEQEEQMARRIEDFCQRLIPAHH